MAIVSPVSSVGYGASQNTDARTAEIVQQMLAQMFGKQGGGGGVEGLGYTAPAAMFPQTPLGGNLPLIEGVKGGNYESVTAQLQQGGNVGSQGPLGAMNAPAGQVAPPQGLQLNQPNMSSFDVGMLDGDDGGESGGLNVGLDDIKSVGGAAYDLYNTITGPGERGDMGGSAYDAQRAGERGGYGSSSYQPGIAGGTAPATSISGGFDPSLYTNSNLTPVTLDANLMEAGGLYPGSVPNYSLFGDSNAGFAIDPSQFSLTGKGQLFPGSQPNITSEDALGGSIDPGFYPGADAAGVTGGTNLLGAAGGLLGAGMGIYGLTQADSPLAYTLAGLQTAGGLGTAAQGLGIGGSVAGSVAGVAGGAAGLATGIYGLTQAETTGERAMAATQTAVGAGTAAYGLGVATGAISSGAATAAISGLVGAGTASLLGTLGPIGAGAAVLWALGTGIDALVTGMEPEYLRLPFGRGFSSSDRLNSQLSKFTGMQATNAIRQSIQQSSGPMDLLAMASMGAGLAPNGELHFSHATAGHGGDVDDIMSSDYYYLTKNVEAGDPRAIREFLSGVQISAGEGGAATPNWEVTDNYRRQFVAQLTPDQQAAVLGPPSADGTYNGLFQAPPQEYGIEGYRTNLEGAAQQTYASNQRLKDSGESFYDYNPEIASGRQSVFGQDQTADRISRLNPNFRDLSQYDAIRNEIEGRYLPMYQQQLPTGGGDTSLNL